MHGIIFASLEDYSRKRFGGVATVQIFAARSFAMSETYPDADLSDLLERAAAHARLPIETAQTTFARLYPAFFTIAGDTRTFLLGVEDRIHELVRATMPEADPPALLVCPLGGDGVAIEYSSPRRLCRLLEGLVVGTGHHYHEHITIRETRCMHTGAAGCRFKVTARHQ